MVNGQMDHLIRQAQREVSERGEQASDRQVMLACFGWLGNKLGTRNGDYKRWAVVALAFGAGISGGIGAVLKALEMV